MIGSMVDQFRILQAMGSSPLADSFIAVHAQTGGKFILKALKPQIMSNDAFKKALLTETVQLIKVNHPNIVSPSNLLEVGGRLYLVSEFMEGQTISQMLQQNQERLAIDGILRIFKDLLRGFGYAHTEGMVHNLLTPESILVTPDGEAKILGFGWTYQREKHRLSTEQEKLYYAHYFAPERFNNPETRDVRANLYSLGVILYQTVVGQTPFRANSIFELEMAHGQTQPENPKTFRSDLPKGLSSAILKALAKRPEERYQTALEFYKEIEKVESMRRSELFQDDFVKGFGEIDSFDGQTGVFKDGQDTSASFKIEDAFSEGSMDFNFDLPSETGGASDPFNSDTIRDSNFSMDALTSPPPSPPAASAPAAKPQPTPAADEFNFGSDFGDMSFGAPEPVSPEPPQEEPGQGMDDMGNFDFGDLSMNTPPLDLDASKNFSFDDAAALQASPTPEPADHPSDFNFNTEFDQLPSLDIADDHPHAQRLQTEDGAFSFDIEEGTNDFPPPPTDTFDGMEAPDAPSVRRAREGLKASLDAAEPRMPLPSPTIRVKKRVDKKVLAGTAVLAVLALAFVGFWLFTKMQASKHEKIIREIQSLKTAKQYQQAQSQIDQQLAKASGDFKRDLNNLKNQIEEETLEIEVQVRNLVERAREQEIKGQVFEDGQNDASATYRKILDLDPSNDTAKTALERIISEQSQKAQALLAEEKSVEALKLLNLLSRTFPTNRDLKNQTEQLRDKLVAEKASTLKLEINQLYQREQYDRIPELYGQLKEIEPKSDFVQEMNKMLVSTFSRLGDEARSKLDLQKAAKYYRAALEIDPRETQLSKSLSELDEEIQRVGIERAQNNLDDAVNNRNWVLIYKYSQELNQLDPGNTTAHNAQIQVNDYLQGQMAEAGKQRELGQYKKAAGIYKTVFEISGDSKAQELWQKYDKWSPPEGMAFVPAGSYSMGSYAEFDTRPPHEVNLTPFFIGAHEVTNAEYKRFIDARPEWAPTRINAKFHDGNYLKDWDGNAPPRGKENYPVRYVSWFAAQAYATYVGKRLPTEAEWEKAASGGNFGQKYWWGNSPDAKKAVYEFYAGKSTAPVTSFPPNGYGIYEILGNVEEWVQDTYNPNFYSNSPTDNPVNDVDGLKVTRGGHFKSRGKDITVYTRAKYDPRTCEAVVGFRVAQTTRAE
ncbi:MAG: SUMF1/EgtB/PvdO family nonheme iron enzyme [Acidobacteria bacterium]|nr:SUMF1/EgtB/PvdO family nonheme iron enzyme [Acidobacteriota bacterium]MCB9398479.1 SUMF1/EgtB/PvdO family nonheme iron enzyme [Acidobacteriota bacterium]